MYNFLCVPHINVTVFEKFDNKKNSLVYYQGRDHMINFRKKLR